MHHEQKYTISETKSIPYEQSYYSTPESPMCSRKKPRVETRVTRERSGAVTHMPTTVRSESTTRRVHNEQTAIYGSPEETVSIQDRSYGYGSSVTGMTDTSKYTGSHKERFSEGS